MTDLRAARADINAALDRADEYMAGYHDRQVARMEQERARHTSQCAYAATAGFVLGITMASAVLAGLSWSTHTSALSKRSTRQGR